MKCVIAGDGEMRGELEALVSSLRLEHRVQLVGEIGSEELVEYLARCRAVCFPAFDEDYGFVTVEAFAASKAVVTCTDSGGPTELVRDGIEGYVTPPTPEGLALALARLVDDERTARDLGAAGKEAVSGMTWDSVVSRLVIA
jgi:glycosyltransferase involved in cell wall biosynthesis